MASSVAKLIWKQLLRNEVISEHQTNIDQQDQTQSAQQRRHSIHSSVSSDNEIRNICSLNTRLSTPIGTVERCSASRDEIFYGSKFIEQWYRKFTEENGEITFNSIYEPLVMGLKQEGEIDPKDVASMAEVMDILNTVRTETVGKSRKQKMKVLQQRCVILYKKDTYVYRVVNTALRDKDYSKLRTVGPFCYLLFNYVGRHHNDYSSIKRLFTGALRSTKDKQITVYRGDTIYDGKLIEDYQQAIKDDSISFKWQSFVSTSRNERVAQNFGENVLYIIELDHHSAKDQCVELDKIPPFQGEEEVLLRPGVRFKVTKMEFDNSSQRYMISIKILPSYVSQL
jgi:hypothetical protein